MRKQILFILMLVTGFSGSAWAELYLEAAVESGSEELVTTYQGDNLYSGGGVKLALGIQQPLQPDASSFRVAVGYLSDSVVAGNGTAAIDTVTLDAQFLLASGPHRVGVGPTVHFSPRYSDRVAGYPALDLEFETALGVVFSYGYQPFPGLEIGARVSQIDYSNARTTIDAGSIGVYLSNGF